uniref:Uncharacterized protein n=1 Tax=Lutzomyia longipalpis TaxID=7200 RepID=A0A7G3B6U0_LUTLO
MLNWSNLFRNVFDMYANVIHASLITCDRNSFNISRNAIDRSFKYCGKSVVCVCGPSIRSDRMFFRASTLFSQSIVLSPMSFMMFFIFSSKSRAPKIVTAGTASKHASKTSCETAPTAKSPPPGTPQPSIPAGLRGGADGTRFTRRVGLGIAAVSMSSEFVRACDVCADGSSSPSLRISSNLPSSIANFDIGTSFFCKSARNLSPTCL